jgi:hypothetical protein
LYLSKKRIRILKEVTRNSVFVALNRSLKGFQDKVAHYRDDQSDLLLFDPYFSVEEMTRIHKQLNGALIYSEPVVVNEWMDVELHAKLVNSLLGESIQKTVTPKTFLTRWRDEIKELEKDEWKKNVNAAAFSFDTIAPFKLDLWNTNENKVFKLVDFSKSEKSVLQQLHEVYILSKESTAQGIGFYVVYESPRTSETKKLVKKWKHELKDSKWITFQQFVKTYLK